MRRLFSFFARAWMISLIGVLVISLLIWFAGPFLAFAGWVPLESEFTRLIVILVIFAMWLLRRLWVWQLEKRTNNALVEDLSEQTGGDDDTQRSAEEVETLGRRLSEALAVLRKARLGSESGVRRTQKLYQLPWYIFIGPPGSGKTTALLNSGLRFPLEERFGKGAIGGVGGTRNCDWFFTDQAVMVDTAGRYTTQDSNEAVDSAAWEGFLQLLRKHRRRRPINGTLVAISLADMMSLSEADRMDHAVTVRRRLQELHKHLGIRFPVYVLFTKCDLVAGFTEFFDDLGREERAQVWGMTFPYDHGGEEGGVVEQFSAEFEALDGGLNARLIERLQQERDPRRRGLIYGFPRQFSSLRRLAEQFLLEAFRPTRYEEHTLLRGVYFTSGTQEGSPIDRLMGSLARTFGLERPQTTPLSGSGRSYFIQNLLTDVVFPESELAGTNLRLERGRAWLQRGAWAGAIGLAALAVGAWVTSYARNDAYVEQVSGQATEIEQLLDRIPVDDPGMESVLPVLNAARDIAGGYADRDASVPWSMGLGLYQGDKLGSEAQTAYQRLLRTLLLPRVMLRIEAQLSDSSANYDYLYEGLKTYLMLGDPTHFDADTVSAWVGLDWDQTLSRRLQADQLQQLRGHLDALLAAMPMPLPMPLHGDLIASVRDFLQRVPLADRVYQRLRRTQLDSNLPEFRVIDGAGRDAPLVFVRRSGEALTAGIPSFYTAKGYRDAFLGQSSLVGAQLTAEGWVLGKDSSTEETVNDLLGLSEEVRQLYLIDYARHWEDLLADIDITPFTGVQQAAEVLRVSSGPASPIRLLLQAVDRHTSLSRVEAEPTAVGEQVSGALSGVKRKLAALIGESGLPAAVTAEAAPNIVEERFHRLNSVVQGGDGGGASIDNVIALLDEAFVLMNSIASASGRGETAVQVARDQAGGTLGRIKLEAQRQPPPLSRWLQALAQGGSGVALGGARAHLNDLWQGDAQQRCREATSGRYPFDTSGSTEIGLDDFGLLFSSGGLLDQFFNEQLRPFVDSTRRPWRWRGDASRKLGMSDAVLVQFQRASEIRDAFFPSGGPKPRVSFQLKPLSMDSAISQFLLSIDGQTLTYSHGPIRPSALQWPGPDGVGQAHMQISPAAADGRSSVSIDGPWALFRLLDRSALEPTGVPEHFRVRFDVGGRAAVYELRAGSARNPFNLNSLHRFRCPGKL